MSDSVQLQFKKAIRRINVTLDKAVTKTQADRLGKFAIKVIVRRTKLGKGVNDSQRSMPLRRQHEHSTGYTEQRKRAKKNKKLHSSTGVKKHNLTFSGELLKNIVILESSKGKVVIGPQGDRNQDVAYHLENRYGYRWLELTIPETNQLIEFYRHKFGDLVKKRH